MVSPRHRNRIMRMPTAVLLALSLNTVAVAAPAADEDAVVLEPLSAAPAYDPLFGRDALLRAFLAGSTPCLGCDARPVAQRRNVAVDVLKYVLWPATPPEPDAATRFAFELKVHDAPDLEYLMP